MKTRDFWSFEDYKAHALYVSAEAEKVLGDLLPRAGERILDVGCGDGELAERLNSLGCAVIGIDSSESMIRAARSRGVEAYVMDAGELDFVQQFDAVFSNAALHWIPDHERFLRRCRRALKPGGRFVAEMGGAGNIATICGALQVSLSRVGIDFEDRNPWFFPTPGEYDALLRGAGFTVETIQLRDRPTEIPTDIAGWMTTFTQELLADLTERDRAAVMDEVVALCGEKLCLPDGRWVVDYVRLNFVASLPVPRQ